MRIAFFTDTYLPATDGIVRGIVDFRHELVRRGNSVPVFAPRHKTGQPRDSHHHYFHSVALPSYPQYRAALFPFPSSQIVKKEKIELVHNHALSSMALAAAHAARENKLPSLFSFHTMVSDAAHYLVPTKFLQGAAGAGMWHYLRWLSSQFDLTTVPSNYACRMLEEQGISPTVLPLGIDTKRFSPGVPDRSFLSAFGVHKDAKIILSLGRVAKEKNLDVLLGAMPLVLKEHPGAKLLVAGKGPYLETLKRNAIAMGLSNSVKFIGFVPEKDIVPLLRCADAFGFPSLFETQGLAALEALSCGTPVVGARASASEDFIKSGVNGILCEPSAKEFSSSLCTLLHSPKKYRAAARRSALLFDKKKRTDELLKLYRKLV